MPWTYTDESHNYRIYVTSRSDYSMAHIRSLNNYKSSLFYVYDYLDTKTMSTEEICKILRKNMAPVEFKNMFGHEMYDVLKCDGKITLSL